MAAKQSREKTPRSKIIVFTLFFTTFLLVTLSWTFTRSGSLNSPPAPWNTDGVFYDNIAFHLSHGKGFYVDLEASPWRSTYVEANKQLPNQGQYDWLMPVKGTGYTALRSPGYPYALAAVYWTFGREYSAARLLGCICVSLGVALLLGFSVNRWGLFPAVISAATLALDYSIMQSAGTIATESLAVLVFAVAFLLGTRAYERPSKRRWALCGLSFGVLLLTRGIWNLGLLILIAVLAITITVPNLRNRFETIRPIHGLCFLLAAGCVAMPWWIRNCVVTEHFQPFGTAGSCGFVAAYCDESLHDYGQWQPKVFNANQIEVQSSMDLDNVDLAKVEYATGVKSLEKTKKWCFKNWTQIPNLMIYRALSHWGLFNRSVPTMFRVANIWLIFVGLIGCFFFTGKLRGFFAFVLILDSFLVMLTWEHLGRYAIPIRPIVHLGYGIAISNLIHKLFRKVKNPSSK